MDEKEKNLNESLTDNKAEQITDSPLEEVNDSSLEEKDGVKYETNDNWQFEAKAPTVDEEFVLENDEFEIPIDELDVPVTKKSTKVVVSENAQAVKSSKSKINGEHIKFVFLAIFMAAVIAVVSVLGVRYYTVPNGKEGDMMNPGSVVATIDGTKVSVGMYSYFYSSIVSYYEQYAAYGYFDLDTTVDYSEQYTTNDEGENITWQEFFEQEALKELKNTTVYYNAGKAAGIKLTSAQQKTIDEQIKTLKDSASKAEVTLDQYIKANFGTFCSEQTLRLMLEQYYITANYKGMSSANSHYTDKEVDAYYNAHKAEYKKIKFSYLAVEYDTTDDATKKKSVDTAKSYMSKMKDADTVLSIVPEVYADYIESDAKKMMESDDKISEKEAVAEATKIYEKNTIAEITGLESPFDEATNAWLFSEDTKIGATNYYIDEESNFIYVILKTETPKLLNDDTYTVRHILVMPETDQSKKDENGKVEPTKQEMMAAKKKAEKILAQYKKGEMTEYNFALLAEEYSEDPGSVSSGSGEGFGGLYEAVPLGQMVKGFENWAIDDSRKYGDTGIVESDYGYHIMFFINHCPQYESDIVRSLREQEMTDLVENAQVKVRDSAIKHVVESGKVVEDVEPSADESTSSAQ